MLNVKTHIENFVYDVPENIKTDEATAKMENGVLKIKLPKEEKDNEKKSKLNIE